MSRRLHRYLLARLLATGALTTAAIAAAALTLDGLERAALLAANDTPAATVLTYLSLRLATVAHLLLPVSLALGGALAVATLRHRGEWDAMRALGASRRTLQAPAVSIAIGVIGALLAFEGFALPTAIERASAVEASAVRGGVARLGGGAGPRWWALDDGMLIAGAIDPSGRRLDDVIWLEGAGKEGGTRRRVDAAALVHGDAGWAAADAAVRAFTATGAGAAKRVERGPRASVLTLPLDGLTPGGIRRRLLPMAQHDLTMLWAAADADARARFTLHARVAHPLAAGLQLWLVLWLAAALPAGRARAAVVALLVCGLAGLLGVLSAALAPALGWSPLLPWGVVALLAGALYWTSKYDASERNQPLVQSA